ncbi:MAG TPA: Ig-like domain repeat protein [Candidatus Acidoferrales bacterium]|nr:Ig-like domain repeat protein [Candidatus Acidoferrales bacterium]
MSRRPLYRALPAVIAMLVFFALCHLPARAQTANRKPAGSLITQSVDNSARTTIRSSTHPLARPIAAVGSIDPGVPMQRMLLVLGPGAVKEQDARTFIDSQHTPGSAQYHQWLTPAQYGQQFGPAAQDVKQVTAWLIAQGFRVDAVAASGFWIEFSGTAGAVQAAFRTPLQQFQVGAQLHTANASDISVPSALAPVVRGVLSLNDFYSRPSHRVTGETTTAQLSKGSPALTTASGAHVMVPADFATIYDLGPLYAANLNGQGQTIAIVAASNINVNDVANFRSLFNLPPNPPNIILNGPDPGMDGGENQSEASLDAEWAGAVAPNATIDVVVSEGTLTTDPVALGAAYIVDQNLAQILNVSFDQCEQDLGVAGNEFWNSLWRQAAAQGVTVIVSSGDTGAAGCDFNPSTTPAAGAAVNGIASTPFNTSVGGTQFNETVNGASAATFWQPVNGTGKGSALGYIPERVWNESCTPEDASSVCQLNTLFFFLSGGGGVSTVYQVPSYQTLPVTGLSMLNNFTMPSSILHPRGLPDISLAAGALHDPYIFCSSNFAPDCQTNAAGLTTFSNFGGGTSFAAPAFAGLMALINQKMGASQGLANYVLYPLAVAQNFTNCNSSSRTNPGTGTTCVFNDLTVDGNGVPGNDITGIPTAGDTGYPAVTGYDLSTGLGTLDATNLVNAWATAAAAFQGSSTALSASFNGTPLPSATLTIVHGQPVSVNVTVAKQNPGATQTPSGQVSIIAQGGNLSTGAGLGSFALSGSGGTASSGSVVLNDLPGGINYNLSAIFPGDGTFAGSNSAPLVVSVGPESSTTTVQSLIANDIGFAPGNTVAYGDGDNILVLDAQVAGVSGLTPLSGKVSFDIGGQAVLPQTVNSLGVVELQNCFTPLPNCLAPGTYKVTASYTGDGQSYNASKSVSTTITVTAGNPDLFLTAPAAALAGQPITLIANVIPPPLGTIPPTGQIVFLDGSTPLGAPVPVNAGQASATVTLPASGDHDLLAFYSGDAVYNPADAEAILTANAPFSLFTTEDSGSVSAGGSTKFSVVLSGASRFSGQINFACSGVPAGTTCTVNPNPATLSASATSVPITVTIGTATKASLIPVSVRTLPFAFAGLLAMVFSMKRRPKQRILVFATLLLLAGLSACGSRQFATPPTDATITVTATAANSSFTTSIDLSVTINQ